MRDVTAACLSALCSSLPSEEKNSETSGVFPANARNPYTMMLRPRILRKKSNNERGILLKVYVPCEELTTRRTSTSEFYCLVVEILNADQVSR